MKKPAKPRRWNRLIENPPEKGQEILLWFVLKGDHHFRGDYVEIVQRGFDGTYRDQNDIYYVPSKEMRWIPYKRPTRH